VFFFSFSVLEVAGTGDSRWGLGVTGEEGAWRGPAVVATPFERRIERDRIADDGVDMPCHTKSVIAR